MTKPWTKWMVLPHGALGQVDDRVLTVTGFLRMPPMGQVPRRMTIVRLNDGRLVIFSAVALNEPEMARVEAFGTPAHLVVPSALHRMDAKIWKDRYPALRVVAPLGARDKVEEIIPVDASHVDFGDEKVRLVTVPGTGGREAAMIVEGEDGTTLIINDLLFNLGHRSGLRGFVGRLLGMTGDEPHMPPIIRMRLVRDPKALGAELERWSLLPNLKRILVAHGTVITDRPAQVLQGLAAELTRGRPLVQPAESARRSGAFEHPRGGTS